MTDATLRLASTLLFDGGPPAYGPQDFSSLIAVLRRNRVPVSLLPGAAVLAEADGSGAFGSYVREDRWRHERQLAAYLEIAGAWREEGVEGVLIKSPGYFPYTSSNVDVLVASAQAELACRVLESLGYSELVLAREPYKRLFRRVQQPYLGFPVHVHTAVAWINRFLTDAQVLEGRRRSGDHELVLYPSAENVFLITSAHWLYEDKELTLRDLYHASLAVHDGLDWDSARRHAERMGWRPGLEFAIALYALAADRLAARDLRASLPTPQVRARLLERAIERSATGSSAPIRVSKPLCKGLQLAKTARDPRLSTPSMLRELSLVLFFTARAKLPSIRTGPVFVVAVSGPDGAGKTTLARALQQFLEHEAGLSASYHWLRLGTSRVLEQVRLAAVPLLRAATRSRSPTLRRSAAARERRKHLLATRPKVRKAWCYGLLVDFLVRLWAERFRCHIVGGIHIYDRYAIDAAVDLEAMYRFPRASLAVALAPSPTVQLLLEPTGDADGTEHSATVPVTNGELARVYGRYEDAADATMAARQPLQSLLDDAAQLVMTSFVGSSGARGG